MRVGPAGQPLDEKQRKTLLERKVVSQLLESPDGGPRPGVALTIIDAPPAAIFAVLRDYPHFPEFMPYVASAIVDEHTPGRWVVSYVIKGPLGMGNRKYQLEVFDEKEILDGKEVLVSRVQYTGRGDIVSTKGTWQLVPMKDGRSTFVRYAMRTDPGGSFTTFIKNRIATSGLQRVPEAVRKRVTQTHQSR